MIVKRSPCIMSVQYTEGMQYTGGYHEYTGGYHEYTGGYHECERFMSTPGDVQYTGVSIQFSCFLNDPPTFIVISPVYS